MPFLRGDIVHQMIEAHYKKEDPWAVFNKMIEENCDLLRIHAEEYGDLEGLLRTLMTGYFKHYKKEDLKAVSIEGEFKTEIAKGIYLNGKRDMIGISQGMRWMVEHKCHNIIPTSSAVPYHNTQSSIYVWTYNREHEKKVDGVMWNYLLGKPLPRPQLLKNGTLSKKITKTTWAVYKEEIKRHGLKLKDYYDVREQLLGNEEQVYQRQIVPNNEKMMDTIVEDMITSAREMEKLGGKDTSRNIDRHCDYCEFKNLCFAQLKGLDDNFILKSDFKRREKYEREEDKEED